MIVVGFKSCVDKNIWNGLSRRSLEVEIVNKCYMFYNIYDFDIWCKKVGVLINLFLIDKWFLWLVGFI